MGCCRDRERSEARSHQAATERFPAREGFAARIRSPGAPETPVIGRRPLGGFFPRNGYGELAAQKFLHFLVVQSPSSGRGAFTRSACTGSGVAARISAM